LARSGRGQPSGPWQILFNFDQIDPEECAGSSALDHFASGGKMAVREHGKYEEYLHYAEHCLKLVRIATSRKTRTLQREMAAEWFKLADMFSAAERPAE
jgi:hypothetical protein